MNDRDRQQVDIEYTSMKGDRFKRRIQPVPGGLDFNYNAYHPDPQWLITAIDISGDGALKTFAVKQIHSWMPLPISGPLPPMPKHR